MATRKVSLICVSFNIFRIVPRVILHSECVRGGQHCLLSFRPRFFSHGQSGQHLFSLGCIMPPWIIQMAHREIPNTARDCLNTSKYVWGPLPSGLEPSIIECYGTMCTGLLDGFGFGTWNRFKSSFYSIWANWRTFLWFNMFTVRTVITFVACFALRSSGR